MNGMPKTFFRARDVMLLSAAWLVDGILQALLAIFDDTNIFAATWHGFCACLIVPLIGDCLRIYSAISKEPTP